MPGRSSYTRTRTRGRRHAVRHENLDPAPGHRLSDAGRFRAVADPRRRRRAAQPAAAGRAAQRARGFRGSAVAEPRAHFHRRLEREHRPGARLLRADHPARRRRAAALERALGLLPDRPGPTDLRRAMPLTTPQLVQRYLAQAGGDPLQAAAAAKSDRAKNPGDVALANAEHELFAHHVMRQLGPVAGRAVLAAAVPTYTLAKAIGRPVGLFKGSTPPSLQQIKHGLRPIVRPLPPAPVQAIASYVTVGAWPGAQLSSLGDCAAYLYSHGGTGCRGVYVDGSLGPIIPKSALPAPPTTLGDYPQHRGDSGSGYYKLTAADVARGRAA